MGVMDGGSQIDACDTMVREMIRDKRSSLKSAPVDFVLCGYVGVPTVAVRYYIEICHVCTT